MGLGHVSRKGYFCATSGMILRKALGRERVDGADLVEKNESSAGHLISSVSKNHKLYSPKPKATISRQQREPRTWVYM